MVSAGERFELDSNNDGVPDFWNKEGNIPAVAAFDIWDTNAFVSGSHSFAVADTTQSDYGRWFSDFLPLIPGGHYLLSFKR